MINADTTICCLIGDPVEHSLSPVVHNRGYEVLGLNFIYVAFRVRDVKLAIDGIRELGIRGVSVTMPHKVSAVKYIDDIDDTAREIGAINTIVNNGGVLSGFNTDYGAALKALGEKTTIKGKKAVLLGGGGAGLAIATGLKRNGADLIIIDKIKERAEELAKLVGAEGFGGLERLPEIGSADIVINATPVGMWPRTDESIVPRELLHSRLTVFEVNYNPKETRMITEAKEAGCTIIHGYKMFLYQAATQFELFTGHQAPLVDMEQVLIKALEGGDYAASAYRR
jgi:shikimate dehydrogenase